MGGVGFGGEGGRDRVREGKGVGGGGMGKEVGGRET